MITLDDIPEIKGECLCIEIMYWEPRIIKKGKIAKGRDNELITKMFYITQRRDIGWSAPAILVFGTIKDGYKKPKIMYLDQIERLSIMSLDNSIYQDGRRLTH